MGVSGLQPAPSFVASTHSKSEQATLQLSSPQLQSIVVGHGTGSIETGLADLEAGKANAEQRLGQLLGRHFSFTVLQPLPPIASLKRRQAASCDLQSGILFGSTADGAHVD